MRKLIILLFLCTTAFCTTAFGQGKSMLGTQIDISHPLGDPVAFWLFNEGSGGQVLDLSGNSYNGTATGLATRTAAKFGSGFDFDGVSGAGEIEIDMRGSDPLGGKYLTIVAWINWNQDNDTYPRIVDRQYNTQFSFYLIDSSNKLTWAIDGLDAAVDFGANSTVVVPQNEWLQVALTYDGSSPRLFLNGALEQICSGTGVGGTLDPSTDNIIIGEREDGSGRLFDGQIDHVIMWNRPLSTSEIALLYREPFCMMAKDDVALWTPEAAAPTSGQVIMIQAAIPMLLFFVIYLRMKHREDA